jgi:hypothetical protein
VRYLSQANTVRLIYVGIWSALLLVSDAVIWGARSAHDFLDAALAHPFTLALCFVAAAPLTEHAFRWLMLKHQARKKVD